MPINLFLTSSLIIVVSKSDAEILRQGVGLYKAKKFTESVLMLRPLAEKGNVKAQYYFAVSLLEGHTLDKVESEDTALAWDYLKKSADSGYSNSEYTIALSYEMGLYGKIQDQEAGWFWMQRAAKHGNVSAISIVGQTYYGSDFFPEVSKDFKKALYWLNISARKGDSMSMFILSRMYERGLGVAQDYVEAHAWMNLAAAHNAFSPGLETSMRDALERRMTNSQVARAQKIAKELEKEIVEDPLED